MTLFNKAPDKDLNAYLMYSRDGLQDVMVGLVVLLAGFLFYTDNSVFVSMVAVLIYPFLLMGKKIITVPRIHKSEIPPAKVVQKRLLVLMIIGTVTLIAGIGLFLLLSQEWLSIDTAAWSWLTLSIGVLLAVLMGVFLWRGGNRRVPFYIALILGAYLTLSTSTLSFPIVLMVLGGLVTAIGLFIAGRFVLTHPRLAA